MRNWKDKPTEMQIALARRLSLKLGYAGISEAYADLFSRSPPKDVSDYHDLLTRLRKLSGQKA